MGTMQAQPGTFAALEQSLQAPNFQDNTSIQMALGYNAWATELGIGFDALVVEQSHGNDPTNEFPISQIQVMGINQQTPLYVLGIKDNVRYTVALELLRIAGMDGMNSYTAVYAIRKPGSSAADALAALTQVPVIRDPMVTKLNQLKKFNGLL